MGNLCWRILCRKFPYRCNCEQVSSHPPTHEWLVLPGTGGTPFVGVSIGSEQEPPAEAVSGVSSSEGGGGKWELLTDASGGVGSSEWPSGTAHKCQWQWWGGEWQAGSRDCPQTPEAVANLRAGGHMPPPCVAYAPYACPSCRHAPPYSS